MTDWFRSWHGAPTDPKWRTIAKRAGVAPSLVVSLAWVLLDRASQADARGSVDGIDVESIADFLGCEADDVERVIAAMHDKAVLTSDRFTAWDRRQAKREREDDTAAERKAAQRARDKANSGSGEGGTSDVTPCHTTSHHVTPREEERRLDISSLRSDSPLHGVPVVSAEPKDDQIQQPNSGPTAPKASKRRNEYPQDFEDFWKEYPTSENMSKAECYKFWVKLSPVDRCAAKSALPGFKAFCKSNPTYTPIYADRFLSKRRFDGYAASNAKSDLLSPRIDFGGGISAPESTIVDVVRKGHWLPQWGPKRGEPGCRVPERVFEEATA